MILALVAALAAGTPAPAAKPVAGQVACPVSPTSKTHEADEARCMTILDAIAELEKRQGRQGAGSAPGGTDGAGPHLLNVGVVFTSNDYPVAAMRAEATGVSVVSVIIDPAGRPLSCSVTKSSGVPSLDKASCALPMARGKFTPSKPGEQPGSRIVSLPVRWALPTIQRALADVRGDVKLEVRPDGKIKRCRLSTVPDQGHIPNATQSAVCKAVNGLAVSAIAVFRAKLPSIPYVMVLSQGQMIGGPDGARSIGRGSGEQLLAASAAALAIDADGKVVSCEWVDLDTVPMPGPEMCETFAKLEYTSLAEQAVDRSNRHAVVYRAIFTAPLWAMK